MENKVLNAVGVVATTLVGYASEEYPITRGNCFSVITDDDKEYRIVNFIYENWKEMIHRGLSYPIKILPLGEKHALVHDDRIPDEWYRDSYCETCCPRKFWTEPQKLAWERKISRGDLKTSGNFVVSVIRPLHEIFPLFYNKPQPLTTIGTRLHSGYIYAPYILTMKIPELNPIKKMKISDTHLEILNHTLNRAAGRRFCGEPPEMLELVAMGYMRFLTTWMGNPYYTITQKGIEYIQSENDSRQTENI